MWVPFFFWGSSFVWYQRKPDFERTPISISSFSRCQITTHLNFYCKFESGVNFCSCFWHWLEDEIKIGGLFKIWLLLKLQVVQRNWSNGELIAIKCNKDILHTVICNCIHTHLFLAPGFCHSLSNYLEWVVETSNTSFERPDRWLLKCWRPRL